MESLHPHPLMRVPSPARLVALVLLAGIMVGGCALCDTPTDDLSADRQTAVISACEDAALFSAGRTPDHPRFDFDAWEVSTTAGARVSGQSLRWHVRPSGEAQREARLTWSRSLFEPADVISLWLKNPNGHEVSLRLELVDLDGARYLSTPVDLATERGWRQIVFDLTTLRLDEGCEDPCAGIDFPVIAMSLIVSPLTPGRPHTWYIDEIQSQHSPVVAAEVLGLQTPTSLGPGEAMPVRARLRFLDGAPDARRMRAELSSEGGGALAWAPLIPGDAAEDIVEAAATGLRVPAWLPPGRYRLSPASDRVEFSGSAVVSVAVGGPPAAAPQASIATRTRPPLISLGSREIAPVVRELRDDCGTSLPPEATLVGLPATTDRHPFGWAPDAWGPDGEMDARGLDRRAATLLGAAPDALIILQVHLDSSPEWDEANPDHLQRFSGKPLAPPTVFGRKRTVPDIVSPRWQAEAAARLRALVAHVEAAPWGHRVIGYELQAGDLGAWRPWGAALGLGDEATPVREQAFRAWLMARYDDVHAFRDRWMGQRRGLSGAPGAGPGGFEGVRVPQPLADAPEPSLYDPAIDRPMIDLLHFRAEAPADLLLAMADIVRDVAGDDKLIGACYGHMLSQSAEGAWRWPHLALSRVLADDRIDFLTGPQWTPSAPPVPSFPTESARAAGKLYLERVTGEHSARQAASALTTGAGVIADGGALADLGRVADEIAIDRRPEPEAPAVFVVDDVSARYLSPQGGLARALLAGQLRLWAGSGIPCAVHLPGDVLEGGAPRAKLYFFADQMTISPEDGRTLGTTIARDGAMLVWVYGPGSVAERLITGRTMQYLTGIKLSLLPSRGPLQTRIDAAASLPGSGIDGRPVYGLAAGSPRFFSADERVEWLGTLVQPEPDPDMDFCGLALRRFPHCVSVFSAAPLLPAGLIRGLAGRVGVTPWADAAGAAWFGPGIIALEGSAGGPRTVSLPRAATVIDLHTGQAVAEHRQRISLDPGAGEIGLYGVEFE